MEDPVSKSQKKRDANDLKKLGVDFIGLSLEKLDLLPLTDNLRQAIVAAKTIKSNGAISNPDIVPMVSILIVRFSSFLNRCRAI